MSKEVLIFLHMDDAHPGYIADFLTQRKISYRLIRSYAGESVPQLDDSMAALVFMGGIMSANDGDSWIKQEISLIEQALVKRLPVLGHCLGGQLISRALGQPVTATTVKEVGWHDCYRVQLQEEAHKLEADSWLANLKDPFTMFHWHSETFAIPDDAVPLFASAHCENQAYCYAGNVLAMQCHVEMTMALASRWINDWQEDLKASSASEQNYAAISSDLNERISSLNKVAETLYSRWVSSLSIQ